MSNKIKIKLNVNERSVFGTLIATVSHFKMQTQLRVAGHWVEEKLLGKETSSDIEIYVDNMIAREFASKVGEYLLSIGDDTFQSTLKLSHLETRIQIFNTRISFLELKSKNVVDTNHILHNFEEETYQRDFLYLQAIPDLSGFIIDEHKDFWRVARVKTIISHPGDSKDQSDDLKDQSHANEEQIFSDLHPNSDAAQCVNEDVCDASQCVNEDVSDTTQWLYGRPMKLGFGDSLYQTLCPEMDPFVDEIFDVEGDGHCGFRAIAVCLGKVQKDWPNVRRDLTNEIKNNRDFYNSTFTPTSVEAMLKILIVPDRKRVGRDHWLSTEMGLVIATKYKVGVIFITSNYQTNLTCLPLRGAVPRNPSFLVIALVNEHFISVVLKTGHPMPNLDPLWTTYKDADASSWEIVYNDHVKLHLSNSSTDGVHLDDKPRRSVGSSKSRRPRSTTNNKEKDPCSLHAFKEAKAFNKTCEKPSFVRKMGSSYIKKSRMGLPIGFTFSVPTEKKMATLRVLDREWSVGFSCNGRQTSFTVGWKQFVIDNKVVIGDVCVFHTIDTDQARLTVSIFRAYPLQSEASTQSAHGRTQYADSPSAAPPNAQHASHQPAVDDIREMFIHDQPHSPPQTQSQSGMFVHNPLQPPDTQPQASSGVCDPINIEKRLIRILLDLNSIVEQSKTYKEKEVTDLVSQGVKVISDALAVLWKKH